MYSFKDHLKEACDCWKGYKRKPGTKPCAPGSCVKETLELDGSLDPSEIASNPKMYDASIAKKAYYHKSASASDKESLARHLDRHHGNKEWRKPVKEDTVTEGERGLWDNIHAKRKRIKNGSGERMRKPGSKGAPSAADFKAANEETIHVGHRNSKGDWIKTSTHSNYPDAKNAMAELEKQGKKGVQHRYDNAGSIDPGMRKLSNEEVEQIDYLLEYPEDLQKMKKADSYKVGDKVFTKVGGKWHKGHITTPLNKAGNHGVKFQHGGKTHSYVSSPDQLRLHVEEVVAEELTIDEQFDMIEEVIEQLAEEHGVDPESIWETLESVDDIELLEYAVDAKGHKSSTGGLTQKGRDAYNRKTGGNLKMAVTTPPSKLKPGSKAANRRKSFCARMSGVDGPMKKPNGEPTRKALALRKWNC